MLLSFHRLLILILGTAIVSWGCSTKTYNGPTVDAFTGRLTHKGEPVSFPAEENVTLRAIFHKNGQAYGIPIQPDGTFQIGWMPIGQYTALLIREKKPAGGARGRRGPPGSMYTVPDGLNIEEGKTEYVIELGPNWKP